MHSLLPPHSTSSRVAIMRLRRADVIAMVVSAVTLCTLLALISYSMQQRKKISAQNIAAADTSLSAGGAAPAVIADPMLSASSGADAAPPTPFMLLVDVSIILLSLFFFFLVSWIFFYRALFQDYEGM